MVKAGNPFQSVRTYALILGFTLACGCGSSSKFDGVEIRSLGYDLSQGLVQAQVRVVVPDSGERPAGLKDEDFSVVVEDEHIRPKVARVGSDYRLEFPVDRGAAIPSFTVEVAVGGRSLTGEYLTPLWAARYAYALIVNSMFALAALVVAKFSYWAARRYRMAGSISVAAAVAGGVGPPPSSQPPQIVVRLRAVKGNRREIVRDVAVTSVLGNEDRNFQTPFVAIPNEGLRDAHAEIVIQGTSAYVRNLAGIDVGLDRTPLGNNETVPLHDGSRLRLGLVEFEVSLIDPRQGGAA